MVLAMLRYQPVSNTSPAAEKILYSPCWLNGRPYLHPFDGHPDPRRSYVPLCSSYAPVIFDNLDDLTLSLNSTQIETKDMLLKACRIAGDQYARIGERKSMLPEMVILAEDMARIIICDRKKSNGKKSQEVEQSPARTIADPVSLDPI
jgi:hypothetical protein